MTSALERRTKPTLEELGIKDSKHTGRSLQLNRTEFPWLKLSEPLTVPLVKATLSRVNTTILMGSAVRIGTLTDKQSKSRNTTAAYNEALAKIVENKYKGIRKVDTVGSGHTIYQIGGDDANQKGLIIFTAEIAPEMVPKIDEKKYRTFVKIAFSTNEDVESTIAMLSKTNLQG